MEPSAEALAWQRRADAWAQQAEPEQSQAVEPVSRWSEVAATGRPAFPADGVGWRTETAEWRATGARWRQTTEWRSTTGSHGWRSTTEAWQTGGSSDAVPPATTPTAQPAISSTAWPTPAGAEPQHDPTQTWQQPADARPAWQQFADPPSWQQAASPTQHAQTAQPSWQQPAPRQPAEHAQTAQPSWQQPAPRQPAESSSSWQQLVEPTPTSSTPSWNDPPSWRARETPTWNASAQEAPSWSAAAQTSTPGSQRGSIEGSATWADTGTAGDGRRRGETTDTPSWQQSETPSWQQSETPSWQRTETPPQRTETPSWQRSETPSWQTPRDDGRHLVREDDRAAWRRGADLGEGSQQIGRRRAPESGSRISGGTGWAPRSDADNWAGHTDTGSIQLFPDPATPEPPTWGARAEAPSAPDHRRDARGYADRPGRQALPVTPYDDGTARRADPTDYREPPAGGRHGGSGGHRALPATPYDETTGTRSQRTGGHTDADDDMSRTARRYAEGLADLADPGPGPAPAPGRPARDRHAGEGSRYGSVDRGYQPDPRTAAAPTSGFVPGDRGTAAPTSGFAPHARATRYPAGDRSGAAPASGFASRYADDARGGPGGPLREADDPRYVDGARSAPGPARFADQARDEEPTSPLGLDDRRRPDQDRPTGESRRRPGMPSRPRYNQVHDDWREHTGAWEAEPDTSSWTRDPDTGQWSRSEDDPRVRAWRDEAAQREAAQRSLQRRELPAAPADSPRPDDDTTVRGSWPEPEARPARGGLGRAGAMPSSALPTSAIPDASPRRGAPDDTAPRRGMPDDTVPRRGMRDDSVPWRGARDETAPRRGMTGEIMPRRGMPDEPPPRRGTTDGPLPRSGMPDDTTHLRGTPDEPLPRRGMANGPLPRSGMPDDTTHLRGTSAAPMPRRGRPDEPPPRRSAADETMPRGGMPGSGARGVMPSTGIPGSGISGSAIPGVARASVHVYGDDPNRGEPVRESSYRDDPYREDPYREDPYRDDLPGGGRRRADVDDPPSVGRRRAIAEPVVDDEPLSPEAWRRSLESSQGRRPVGPDDWRGGGEGGGAISGYEEWPTRDSAREPQRRAEPGGWQLAEREEAARGSATYREGGAGDWRRELAEEGDLADGESRRYGASEYAPFRSSGAAAVSRSSNLSMTSTSLLIPAGGPDSAGGRAQRASNGWLAPSGSYERRPVGGGFSSGRRSDLLDPDDEEDDQASGGPLAAVGYTVIWYGVPVVLFVFYMLVVNSGVQTHALDTLAKAAPQFGISLVLSVIVAVGLRRASSSWKAVSVGLAAAVVGGGLATVLSSAITGNSLS